MSDEWYYAEGDREVGPLPLARLQEMAGAGELSRSQLVWNERLPDWLPAAEVAELLEHLPGAVLPGSAVPLAYAAPQLNYYNPSGAVVVYAGFWWRVLAWLIDSLVLWLPVHLAQSVMLALFNGPVPTPRGGVPLFPPVRLLPLLTAPLMEWLYFSLTESSSWQATVGKRICGIIVTDQFGNRIGFGRATGRYFGKILSGFLLGIGFLLAGLTERKQALHDLIASTLVIRRNLPRA